MRTKFGMVEWVWKYADWESGMRPVGADAGVVGYLVVVHFVLALLHKALLSVVGTDAGCPSNRFLEV